MTKRRRGPFDGQRQAEALAGFQQAAGIDATAAAQAVNLSYPQYNRYLWGKLPLRTDQLAAFAAAYGVLVQDLARAVGLVEPDDPGWDFLAELQKAWTGDPTGINETYRRLTHAPQDLQRAVIAAIRASDKDDAARARDGHQAPDRTQARASAGKQADFRYRRTDERTA